MADLKENAISLLSSTVIADTKTADTHALYTVPTGKIAIITHVVLHTPSGTLAGGGQDYDFGVAAACSSWKQGVDFATVTAVDHYFVIEENNVVHTIAVADEVFSMKIVTGGTTIRTAVIDVFGYLFDA